MGQDRENRKSRTAAVAQHRLKFIQEVDRDRAGERALGVKEFAVVFILSALLVLRHWVLS